MKLTLTLLLTCAFTLASGQEFDLSMYSKKVSQRQLRGAWEVHYSLYYDDLVESADPYVSRRHPMVLLFEKDSAWGMNYPCVLVHRRKYLYRSNTVQFLVEGMNTTPWELYLRDDTLIMLKGSPPYPEHIQRCVRTTVDPAMVDFLKESKLDTNCLVGRWERETAYHGNSEGDPGEEIIYPFEIPKILSFTAEEARQKTGPGMILQVPVNGVEQPMEIIPLYFQYGYLYLKYGEYEFTFKAVSDQE